jgi:predicted transcriptional regulator of viral defense system
MDDTNGDKPRPDHGCLFAVASEQHGLFTAAQAKACGFGSDLVAHTARSGRFVRVHRGVYRLRDYPSSPEEAVAAAWLAVGKEHAVVSHESALELLGLGDVIADRIHLTVPRAQRYVRPPAGTILHTTTRPLGDEEVVVRGGIRLTDAPRASLDAAEGGTEPVQIAQAVREAVARGLVTPSGLAAAARARGRRVRRVADDALEQAERRAAAR